jgi:hypothetical protein
MILPCLRSLIASEIVLNAGCVAMFEVSGGINQEAQKWFSAPRRTNAKTKRNYLSLTVRRNADFRIFRISE